ncbi:MAG: FtsB family cell division protein [Nocardioides sp.]
MVPTNARQPKTPGSRPRGVRRPASNSARADHRPRVSVSPSQRGADGPAPRPTRITGRAAILVLVLTVLAISYASSARAYLQQRAHIAGLKEQIVARDAGVRALEREKRRWDDPTYVRTQARKRFGYVMPGETGVQVIDLDGNPLGAGRLPDPAEVAQPTPVAWWETAWRSVEIAGNPPPATDQPADGITAPLRRDRANGAPVGRPSDP